MSSLLVRNARVVTCSGNGSAASRLGIVESASVRVEDGRVSAIGPDVGSSSADTILDAGGGALLPGLVDCHTHLVFGGSRVDEFARRMAGEDYRTIAAEGGGIAATVRGTREASEETLFEAAARRARAMRSFGTTTIEVKSGYGLSLEHELRSLRVGRRLDAEGIVRTTTTFLGAHAVPPERRDDRDRYLDEVVDEMLPAVAEEGLADACDVYVDDGAFTLAEGRRVLEKAASLGLRVKAHAGQFEDLGAAELVAELGGLSADHLEAISDDGAAKMADAGVVAVLLPGAWRTLRQNAPPVERLRRAGVRIAVATDLNPGTSPCTDLSLCASLAVRDAGLTLEEAVLAVTVEAARAAGRAEAGRIEVGLPADFALYQHADPRALAYAVGAVRPRTVVLGGRVVHESPENQLPVW